MADWWICSRWPRAPQDLRRAAFPQAGTTGLVMGYYDGNTVTALWNYAQHFAMSDNSYGTNFGPSTPGAHQSDLRPDQRRDQ